ncbi:hypothetical protein LCGC14_2464740 [marine sediment metagenome]|uniref:Uncharacterized protein n=1 Tax=marine sediment metagenome TaxID=412755 RepID=A0A0F9BZX4_9ZZZZ
MSITKEQREILDHTEHNTAGNMFCGDSVDMQVLVDIGMMESIGYKGFVPDEYFRITGLGRKALKEN